MNKKGAFLGLLSTLVMAWAANGANIVWVSLHPGDASPSTAAAGTGFTTAPDKAYTDLLKAHGHPWVYVLSGGLKAWRRARLPLYHALGQPVR